MVNMLDKNNPATQKLVLDALANLLAAGEELGKAKGENEFTKVSVVSTKVVGRERVTAPPPPVACAN
eukprot:scaffold60245_cov49-Phaeocystis_antarctica.AAC.5